MARLGVTGEARLLGWDPDEGWQEDVADVAELAVADSWLVDEGQVRGVDLHRARFLGACREVAGGPGEGELARFWSAALAALPRCEQWFPRVELVRDAGGPQLRLRLRPAPRLGGPVRLTIWPGPDPRTAPRRKGPDLARLGEVRQEAAGRGADDALLTTPDGIVLETTTSSVAWWEGEELCTPAAELPVLPGVTMLLLRRTAAEHGVRVRERMATTGDLDGREVWILNALHGIRPVAAWTQAPLATGAATRAEDWQKRLLGESRPIRG